MPTIDSLHFDVAGWNLVNQAPNARVWRNASNDKLTLNLSMVKPSPLTRPESLEMMRGMYGDSAQQRGGRLIQCDLLDLDGVLSHKVLFAFPQPEPGQGFLYVGSLSLHFPSFEYVIEASCDEQGITGMREMGVLMKLRQEGKYRVEKGEAGPPKGFADGEEYDPGFPDHPLSRCRRHLNEIQTSLKIDADVRTAPG